MREVSRAGEHGAAYEFRSLEFTNTLEKLNVRHSRIHAGRPQTNGHVEALHTTILDECWRPAFARYLFPRYTGLASVARLPRRHAGRS